MSYIFDKLPHYIKGFVRREYTRNLVDGHGDFIPAVFVGVRCVRGLSLQFQAWFVNGSAAGACYLVPIEACVVKPCPMPIKRLIQPWDTFSSEFGIGRIDLFHRSRVYVLPDRAPARYEFTIDFIGTDLTEDPEQHKHLHLVRFDAGHLGGFPNNRLLFEDLAFMNAVADKKPDFVALSHEFFSE